MGPGYSIKLTKPVPSPLHQIRNLAGTSSHKMRLFYAALH